MLARITLIAATLAVVGASPMRAQVDPCDPAIKGKEDRSNPSGYHQRNDRCEGIFIQEVSATGSLLVASLTATMQGFKPETGKPLDVEWKAPGAAKVNLRAYSLRPRLLLPDGYRSGRSVSAPSLAAGDSRHLRAEAHGHRVSRLDLGDRWRPASRTGVRSPDGPRFERCGMAFLPASRCRAPRGSQRDLHDRVTGRRTRRVWQAAPRRSAGLRLLSGRWSGEDRRGRMTEARHLSGAARGRKERRRERREQVLGLSAMTA